MDDWGWAVLLGNDDEDFFDNVVVNMASCHLMNSFNKTEAAVFSCRLCFLRAFPFISLILSSIRMHKGCDRYTTW